MEYFNRGDLLEAVTSMMSDMGKHPETKSSTSGALAALGLMAAQQEQGREKG